MSIVTLQPPGWPRPKGYANGMAGTGRMVFTAGQVGWNAVGEFSENLSEQVGQTLQNIVDVLHEADAKPEHIVRLTWYITDREEYLTHTREIGRVYRDVIGKHFPTMAVVQVTALMEAEAQVEIEATAVVPE